MAKLHPPTLLAPPDSRQLSFLDGAFLASPLPPNHRLGHLKVNQLPGTILVPMVLCNRAKFNSHAPPQLLFGAIR